MSILSYGKKQLFQNYQKLYLNNDNYYYLMVNSIKHNNN